MAGNDPCCDGFCLHELEGHAGAWRVGLRRNDDYQPNLAETLSKLQLLDGTTSAACGSSYAYPSIANAISTIS
jgi:hypothetical protein